VPANRCSIASPDAAAADGDFARASPTFDIANGTQLPNLAAMTSQDITKLIVRTAMRDRGAFDLLYRQTSAKLFGVCLRVLNDRAEAEEALQEVYVKVWTKADRFAVSDLSPISWLVAVARNHSIDRLRQRRRPAADLDEAIEVADPNPGPEARAVMGDERDRVFSCLEELEDDKAAAVRGAYILGESYVELAERHRVPLNTMRTWLRRSLMKLRECLER
jgi:RNA polymerase sigma-70 factor, ECF subfamily